MCSSCQGTTPTTVVAVGTFGEPQAATSITWASLVLLTHTRCSVNSCHMFTHKPEKVNSLNLNIWLTIIHCWPMRNNHFLSFDQHFTSSFILFGYNNWFKIYWKSIFSQRILKAVQFTIRSSFLFITHL
jgi:hypothetical protein